MSKPTIVWMSLLAACATGSGMDTTVQQDAAVTTHHDASNVNSADAAHSDAGTVVGQDAQVSQLPDASTGGGGPFCAGNSECTVSGECCVTLGGPGFCAPGDVIAGVCFPQ